MLSNNPNGHGQQRSTKNSFPRQGIAPVRYTNVSGKIAAKIKTLTRKLGRDDFYKIPDSTLISRSCKRRKNCASVANI